MEKIHNFNVLRERRKGLRRSLTLYEKILWVHVRNSKLGFKFYRQHSLGLYVVDFYCPKARLIVEIDGKHHAEKDTKLYDSERTGFFESFNFKVLRFWNDEIHTNIQKVLKRIQGYLPLLDKEGIGEESDKN